MRKNGEGKLCKTQQWDGWAGGSALRPRQLHLLLPLLEAGELMLLWPPLAPSVDPSPCIIIHLQPVLENVLCLCQNNVCTPASLCVIDKPNKSSQTQGTSG